MGERKRQRGRQVLSAVFRIDGQVAIGVGAEPSRIIMIRQDRLGEIDVRFVDFVELAEQNAEFRRGGCADLSRSSDVAREAFLVGRDAIRDLSQVRQDVRFPVVGHLRSLVLLDRGGGGRQRLLVLAGLGQLDRLSDLLGSLEASGSEPVAQVLFLANTDCERAQNDHDSEQLWEASHGAFLQTGRGRRTNGRRGFRRDLQIFAFADGAIKFIPRRRALFCSTRDEFMEPQRDGGSRDEKTRESPRLDHQARRSGFG